MKIEKAKEVIQELQHYVDIYENYHPETIKQNAVKLYAELENVNEVAKTLNEMGYRKGGRIVAGKRRQVKLESNDITEILISDIDEGDLLHPIVKKALNRNRRRKGIVI